MTPTGLLSRGTARYVEGALVATAIGGWVLSQGAETYVVADAFEIGGRLGFAMYGTVFGLAATPNDPGGRVDTLLQHLVAVVFIVGVMAVVRLYGFGSLEHRFMFSMLDTFTVILATFFASAAIGMIRLPGVAHETPRVSTAD